MKKRILLILPIVFICLFLIILLGQRWMEQKKEKDRLAQPAYFTEYKLTAEEYRMMGRLYRVYTEPHYDSSEDLSLWPDYSHYTITATEDTEVIVVVLNHVLFEVCHPENEAAWTKAEEYGFSAENPITVEWVMIHPKEAVDIIHSTVAGGTWFTHYGSVEEEYERIMEAAETETE